MGTWFGGRCARPAGSGGGPDGLRRRAVPARALRGGRQGVPDLSRAVPPRGGGPGGTVPSGRGGIRGGKSRGGPGSPGRVPRVGRLGGPSAPGATAQGRGPLPAEKGARSRGGPGTPREGGHGGVGARAGVVLPGP